VQVSVAIEHPSATFRTGLIGASGEGWKAATRDDAEVILVSVHDEDAWTEIGVLVARDQLSVVAMIPGLDPAAFRRALSAGVEGVVDENAGPEIIIRAAEAARHGEVVVAAEMARQLASGLRRMPRRALTQAEVDVMQGLADGKTLRYLAESLGWGERTVRRRLQNACLKLGVPTRSEAIKVAAASGIIQ
jgi:DNA-binding NarL/FixJ family response regulator